MPFRANIDALKRLGCNDVLSLSAVGSLREELKPGTFVIVDQFIDRTFARNKTFFDKNIVAHVSMAKPICEITASIVFEASKDNIFKHSLRRNLSCYGRPSIFFIS